MTLRYKLSQGQRFKFKYLLDLTFLSASILVSSLKSFSQKFLTFSSRHNFKPFPNVTLGEKKIKVKHFTTLSLSILLFFFVSRLKSFPQSIIRKWLRMFFFLIWPWNRLKGQSQFFFIGCSVVLYHISIVKH